MDEPAEIHRWTGGERRDITVARGPLLAMARGLMAIDPGERADFWITSARGNLTAAEAEESLRRWQVRH
jgi:hypothetical protein